MGYSWIFSDAVVIPWRCSFYWNTGWKQRILQAVVPSNIDNALVQYRWHFRNEILVRSYDLYTPAMPFLHVRFQNSCKESGNTLPFFAFFFLVLSFFVYVFFRILNFFPAFFCRNWGENLKKRVKIFHHILFIMYSILYTS